MLWIAWAAALTAARERVDTRAAGMSRKTVVKGESGRRQPPQGDRRNGAALRVHVRTPGGDIADEDREYIIDKLGTRLGKFGSALERITVRVTDANGPKGGRDQHCQIKVVVRGLPSVVVNEMDSTVVRAFDRAIDRTAVAVQRTLQRRRLKPLHHRTAEATA